MNEDDTEEKPLTDIASDAPSCSVSDLHEPSGAWSRTDYVREYDKVKSELEDAVIALADACYCQRGFVPFTAVKFLGVKELNRAKDRLDKERNSLLPNVKNNRSP